MDYLLLVARHTGMEPQPGSRANVPGDVHEVLDFGNALKKSAERGRKTRKENLKSGTERIVNALCLFDRARMGSLYYHSAFRCWPSAGADVGATALAAFASPVGATVFAEFFAEVFAEVFATFAAGVFLGAILRRVE